MAGSKGLKRVNVGLDLSSAEYHDETGIEIVSGTSFPASPAQKDLFYRTDLNIWFQHTGGDWQAVGEPHIPSNYQIFKDGANYKARDGRDGKIDYNDSDLYTVLNGALGSLDTYGGKIYLDLDGSHTLSTGLSIAGDGGDLAPSKTVTLEGKGMYATVLAPADGITAITTSNALKLNLWNLAINVPDNSSGKGISGHSLRFSNFKNIFIKKLVSSVNALHLINPLFCHFENIRVYSDAGVLLEASTTAGGFGNSQFDLLRIENYGNNSVGLKLVGDSANSSRIVLSLFNWTQINSSVDKTGTIGLLLDDWSRRCIFNYLHIENHGTAIKLDGYSIDHILQGTYIFPKQGGTFINVADANAKANRFGPFTRVQPTGAGAFTLINDVTTDTSEGLRNVYQDIYTTGGTPSITRTSALLRNVAGVTDYDVWELGDHGIQVRNDIGDYGGSFSTYTPPQGYNGMIIVAEDTNAGTPGRRLYAYSNGTWRYVALS